MKKLIALVLALACVLIWVSCNNVQEEKVLTYSFYGEHEYFLISNGSIVLYDKEEVFDGGNLETTQSDMFEGVVSYSTTFYTLINEERRVILSNTITVQTGGTVKVDGRLGKIYGENAVIGNKVGNIDELKENLWFELKTTDLNGTERVYQIQLTLT